MARSSRLGGGKGLPGAGAKLTNWFGFRIAAGSLALATTASCPCMAAVLVTVPEALAATFTVTVTGG